MLDFEVIDRGKAGPECAARQAECAIDAVWVCGICGAFLCEPCGKEAAVAYLTGQPARIVCPNCDSEQGGASET